MDAQQEEAGEWTDTFLTCARFGELTDMQAMMASANEEERHMATVAIDAHGNTALHMAAANGHLDVCRYLLEDMQADPNCQNAAGNTALHWAVMNQQQDVVQYFLTESASSSSIFKKAIDINCVNKEGFTAAMEAQRFQLENMVALFFEHPKSLEDKDASSS